TDRSESCDHSERRQSLLDDGPAGCSVLFPAAAGNVRGHRHGHSDPLLVPVSRRSGKLAQRGRASSPCPGVDRRSSCGYAGFFWLTKWLIEGITQPGNQDLRVIVWMSCGAAVLISWCLAAMPMRL